MRRGRRSSLRHPPLDQVRRCSDGSAGSGATLLQRAQQDQQDGAQLDLERRPHLAKRRFARGMARRVLGCGDAGLIAFDDLQQRHHTFVEVRVLGRSRLISLSRSSAISDRAGEPSWVAVGRPLTSASCAPAPGPAASHAAQPRSRPSSALVHLVPAWLIPVPGARKGRRLAGCGEVSQRRVNVVISSPLRHCACPGVSTPAAPANPKPARGPVTVGAACEAT